MKRKTALFSALLLMFAAMLMFTGKISDAQAETVTVKKKVIVGQVRMVKKMEKLVVIAAPRPGDMHTGQELLIDSNGREIKLTIKMPASSSLLCSVQGSSNFSAVSKDMWVYIYRDEQVTVTPAPAEKAQPVEITPAPEVVKVEEEKQKQQIAEENKQNEKKIEEDIKTMSFLSVTLKVNSNNYESDGPVYHKTAGIIGGHVNASFFNYKLSVKAGYERPSLGDTTYAKSEAFANASFPLIRSVLQISGFGEYRYISDAESVYTSSYAKGGLTLGIPAIFGKPKATYHHYYFFNDYNGDREKAKDYDILLNWNPLSEYFYSINMYINADVDARYKNRQYFISKSTSTATPVKGFSDVTGSIRCTYYMMDVFSVDAEYAYTRIPSKDFSVATGNTQHKISLGASLRPTSSTILSGGWDYIKLPNANVLFMDKTASLYYFSIRTNF